MPPAGHFCPESQKWRILLKPDVLWSKDFLKNFQPYYLLNKPTYPDKSGRATSLVREEFSPDKGSCSAELVGFASTQSDKWKIFRLFRAVFLFWWTNLPLNSFHNLTRPQYSWASFGHPLLTERDILPFSFPSLTRGGGEAGGVWEGVGGWGCSQQFHEWKILSWCLISFSWFLMQDWYFWNCPKYNEKFFVKVFS